MNTANDPFAIVLLGWQGSAVPWSFTVTNPDTTDPTQPGTPIDVSGWTVMYTVKKNYADSDANAIYTFDSIMPEGSTDGVISGELPDTKTQTLAPGPYLWDVRIINLTSPEPQMLAAGQIVIQKTVGTRLTPNLGAGP